MYIFLRVGYNTYIYICIPRCIPYNHSKKKSRPYAEENKQFYLHNHRKASRYITSVKMWYLMCTSYIHRYLLFFIGITSAYI